jgi:hypothetical protein
MKRFIEESERTQLTLLPESLDDYIGESNPVRAIEAFVAHLDLAELGFEVVPEATGRPGYRSSVLLRLYICGYLNRISSSRCLEREAGRNLEVIWLLGRLAPDDKVIADFPERQWSRDQEGMREVRRAVPADRAAGEGKRCHRWLQVQSREQSRQELHVQQNRLAAGSA